MSRYLAEFIGTFVLVFAGCGAAVLSGGQAGALGVAVAFGLALLAMVYTIGHISGCHINPAVTLGLFISKKMPRKDAPGYWIAQIAGGIVAAGVLLVIAHGMPGGYNPAAQGLAANGYAAHSPGHYTLGAAALTEFVFTFILVITVIGATDLDAPVGFAGIPIGLALLLANLVAIPVTNASINPARSIGPAIFTGGWAIHQLWLFIVAPLLGGVVASGVYRLIGLPRLHAREAIRAPHAVRVERVPETPEQPERPRRTA
ncbi:MAG TPA: aquaporin Z [Bryobacteraceae bacterium]|nr:aquaporin Z [Bryobacteraceae bacterium]